MARSVTGGSDAKSSARRGQVPISVFDDPNNIISVDWIDPASDEQLIALGEERAKKRGSGRKFHGWASLSVEVARRKKRVVKYAPTEETEQDSANPFHVNIILPSDMTDDIRTEHLQELAKASRWEPVEARKKPLLLMKPVA